MWLEKELAAANTPAARATHPWVFLMGHKVGALPILLLELTLTYLYAYLPAYLPCS